MSIAYVSSGKGRTSATFDSTGATFIAVWIAGDGTATVSDNKGNSSWQYGTAGAEGRWAYHESPTVGTSHTISVSPSYVYVFPIALTGVATSPLDGQAGGNQSAASAGPYTFSNGSITPSQDGDILLAGITFGNTAGFSSISGGFTCVQDQTGVSGSYYGGAIAHLIQTTAAAANPTWTTTAPTTNTAHELRMIALKASGSGGGSASATAAAGAATVSAIGGSTARTTATAAAGAATVSGVGGTLVVLVSSTFKNNTGTPLASLTNVTAWVHAVETGALVVKLTGRTTNASGICTLQDAAIVTGTTYRVTYRNEATGDWGSELVTAS